MKGSRVRYTAEELAWIERNCELPRTDLHTKFCKRFGRRDVSVDNIKSLCTRRGWKTGRDGRYVPGSIPQNKGKKMPYNERCAATQFKKGHAPHNTHHLGHERTDRDGYVWVSVPETNPHTGYHRRYVMKHRWLWQKLNGPLPKDMVLKCLDGNKSNTDPENWEAIPRAMLPRLNGRFGRNYDDAPAALKPTIMAIAKIEHKARSIGGANEP